MSEPKAESRSPSLDVTQEGIARVTFDAPDRSANVLDRRTLEALEDVLGEVHRGIESGRVRGVLFRSGKPGTFIVGADIEAIAAIEDPQEGAEAVRAGQELYLSIERLPVPTLTAVGGTCLGGGAELALATTYRVMSDHPRARIGLPEVQLGILPAWGGTTRLPRLVGLQAALDLLLTGRAVDGRKARRIGLVEEVLPEGGFDVAAEKFLLARIEESVRTGARRGFFRRLLEDTAPGRAVVLRTARRQVMSRTGGHYPAPLRILEVVRASLGRSVERALEIEAAAAGELLVSSVSKNLIHVFHLRERARRGHALAVEAEARDVEELGVLGAGVMGGGIAQLAAYHGLRVRMKDIDHGAIARGLRHARGLFDQAVKRRRLSSREAAQAMGRISGALDYAGFGRVDLVVEAVVERLDVKRQVLREAESQVRDGCVLTTNTSTLSVDAMAEALERPRDFCGMHFFNPVHRMPLVEVVRGAASGDGAVASVHALTLRLGKVPVVVRDGPGFLVNRILGPYMNEAGHLLAEGASVEAVDREAREFGMPMGPLRLIDEVGIDVARHAGGILHEAFGERLSPSAPLLALGESGRLGAKGGLGFYRYEDGKEKGVDPGIYEALGAAVPARRKNPPPEDIRSRLFLAMINEAARALEDRVAASAGDVDLAMIMGTGFPPFRGGLLRFADDHHPRYLVERLRELEHSAGARFAPAPTLVRLAEEDRGFYRAFPTEHG